MSAADKVALVNTVNGASRLTSAAARAFIVIYNGKVVDYLNCSLGAGLFTFSAGYTALVAVFANGGTLVMIITLNYYSYGITHEVYNSVRASLCAKTATYALSRVNAGNALFLVYANGVTGANRNAITVAKASKGAESVTRIAHIGCTAGFRSLVFIFSFFGKA